MLWFKMVSNGIYVFKFNSPKHVPFWVPFTHETFLWQQNVPMCDNIFQVCGGADRYLGFQKQLSFCLCKVQDLEQVCDEPCRIQSKRFITFHCPEEPMTPFIQIKKELTDGSLSTVVCIYILSYYEPLTTTTCFK